MLIRLIWRKKRVILKGKTENFWSKFQKNTKFWSKMELKCEVCARAPPTVRTDQLECSGCNKLHPPLGHMMGPNWSARHYRPIGALQVEILGGVPIFRIVAGGPLRRLISIKKSRTDLGPISIPKLLLFSPYFWVKIWWKNKQKQAGGGTPP